ncbi:MAG: TMEM165/GDT1 family protein, partial [Clostridiales bacterium]
LGVAIGSFFSHGLAILFGSSLALFENQILHHTIELITYSSFIIMGILSLLPKKEKLVMDNSKKENLLYKITNLKINYCFLIALCIMIGELGDKTFLASIGLGIQYSNYKLSLILGAIFAMVACDYIAIVLGRFLNKYISEQSMQKLSGILFLIFGFIGFISM